MNINSLNKRVSNLQKIYSKIHISKLKTINQLAHQRNHSNASLHSAWRAKQIYEYARTRFRIHSNFYENSKSTFQKPTLWIYFSAKKNLLSEKNSILQEIIKNRAHSDDLFIPVGLEAIAFCKAQKFTTLGAYESFEDAELQLVYVITALFETQSIQYVKILLHSPWTTNDGLTILPLKQMTWLRGTQDPQIINMTTKYTFYPDLHNVLEHLFYNYITNVLKTIVAESNIYLIKQKILKHNVSEKTIEDKVRFFKHQISKLKQENLNNEIILISNIKRQEKNVGASNYE